jgi:hypothetical protein
VPRRGHLAGHDALDVGIDLDHVDGGDSAFGARAQLHVAAVGAAVDAVYRAAHQADRAARAHDLERPAEAGHDALALLDGEAAAGAHDLVERARVERRGARPAGPAEADVRVAGLEQHAHAAARCAADLGALVVVGQDLAMVAAVLGVAVRAVLAHADAVPEAAAAHGPAHGGIARRGGEAQGEEGCEQGETAHGTTNKRWIGR